MYSPGEIVVVRRLREPNPVVRLQRFDARFGAWVGVAQNGGTRTFRESEIVARRVPEGFRCVLPLTLRLGR